MSQILKSCGKVFLSCFGVGYLPIASGTAGSALAALGIYFLQPLFSSFCSFTKILLILSAAGLLFSMSTGFIKICAPKEDYDQSWIVIDEAIGMLLSSIPIFFIKDNTVILLVLAFFLFRFFDILKPLGIRKIDQKHTVVSVLLDDVLAGVYTLIVLFVIYILS